MGLRLNLAAALHGLASRKPLSLIPVYRAASKVTMAAGREWTADHYSIGSRNNPELERNLNIRSIVNYIEAASTKDELDAVEELGRYARQRLADAGWDLDAAMPSLRVMQTGGSSSSSRSSSQSSASESSKSESSESDGFGHPLRHLIEHLNLLP